MRRATTQLGANSSTRIDGCASGDSNTSIAASLPRFMRMLQSVSFLGLFMLVPMAGLTSVACVVGTLFQSRPCLDLNDSGSNVLSGINGAIFLVSALGVTMYPKLDHLFEGPEMVA